MLHRSADWIIDLTTALGSAEFRAERPKWAQGCHWSNVRFGSKADPRPLTAGMGGKRTLACGSGRLERFVNPARDIVLDQRARVARAGRSRSTAQALACVAPVTTLPIPKNSWVTPL